MPAPTPLAENLKVIWEAPMEAVLDIAQGGRLQPRQGSITLHENLKTAYFGQTNIDRLDPDNTVQEEVLSANGELSPNVVRNICGAMLFEGGAALKKVSVLSGGEKSRVLLGKLLVSPANLLLLDEPTNHLDMESIDSLVEAIEVFENEAAPVGGPVPGKRRQVHPLERLETTRAHFNTLLPKLEGVHKVVGWEGELWSPRKMLRRTLWHERDHTEHIRKLL